MCPLLLKHGIPENALCYRGHGQVKSIEELNEWKKVCLNCPMKGKCIFDSKNPLTPEEKEELLNGELPKWERV